MRLIPAPTFALLYEEETALVAPALTEEEARQEMASPEHVVAFSAMMPVVARMEPA